MEEDNPTKEYLDLGVKGRFEITIAPWQIIDANGINILYEVETSRGKRYFVRLAGRKTRLLNDLLDGKFKTKPNGSVYEIKPGLYREVAQRLSKEQLPVSPLIKKRRGPTVQTQYSSEQQPQDFLNQEEPLASDHSGREPDIAGSDDSVYWGSAGEPSFHVNVSSINTSTTSTVDYAPNLTGSNSQSASADSAPTLAGALNAAPAQKAHRPKVQFKKDLITKAEYEKHRPEIDKLLLEYNGGNGRKYHKAYITKGAASQIIHDSKQYKVPLKDLLLFSAEVADRRHMRWYGAKKDDKHKWVYIRQSDVADALSELKHITPGTLKKMKVNMHVKGPVNRAVTEGARRGQGRSKQWWVA